MSSAAIWKNPPNEEDSMNIPDSDPLVFFGAIGDLAHKPLLNCISPTFQLRI
jgi:hypothetical protein